MLSNEPGYYQAECFGVRIENLLAVEKADVAIGAGRQGVSPVLLKNTRSPSTSTCIDVTMLDAAEVEWVDAYHADVRAQLAPLLEGEALDWLVRKTEPRVIVTVSYHTTFRRTSAPHRGNPGRLISGRDSA